MIPGDFATIDDLSYWLPDMANTKKMVANMLAVSHNKQQYGYSKKP